MFQSVLRYPLHLLFGFTRDPKVHLSTEKERSKMVVAESFACSKCLFTVGRSRNLYVWEGWFFPQLLFRGIESHQDRATFWFCPTCTKCDPHQCNQTCRLQRVRLMAEFGWMCESISSSSSGVQAASAVRVGCSLSVPRGWHWCGVPTGPGRAQGIRHRGGCRLRAQGRARHRPLRHQGGGKYLILELLCASLSSETMMGFATSFPCCWDLSGGPQVAWLHPGSGQSTTERGVSCENITGGWGAPLILQAEQGRLFILHGIFYCICFGGTMTIIHPTPLIAVAWPFRGGRRRDCTEELSIMKHSVSSLPSIPAEQNTEAREMQRFGALKCNLYKQSDSTYVNPCNLWLHLECAFLCLSAYANKFPGTSAVIQNKFEMSSASGTCT